MKQILVAGAALLSLLGAVAAGGLVLSRGPVPSGGAGGDTCPQGTTYPDGCANGVAGTPQDPTLFTSPTVYATRPPWNVAGVDYRVGHSGTLANPATPGALPSCASYSTAGGQNTVTIDTAPCTIDHFDFTLNNGVCLNMTAPTNGATVTITNNNFLAGTGCQPVGGGLINFGGSTNVNAIIRYNSFEQNYNTQFSNIINMAVSTGDRTIEYNQFYRGDQHIVAFGGSGAFTLKYNYAYGIGCCGNHGDWIILGSGAGNTYSLDEGFNTVSIDRNGVGEGNGATAFCYMAPWDGITFTSGKCSNNTYLSFIANDGFGHVSVPIRVEQAGAGTWSPGPFEVSNNYIDWTGSPFPITTSGSVSNKACVGNKNLVTGGGITGTFGFFTCT